MLSCCCMEPNKIGAKVDRLGKALTQGIVPEVKTKEKKDSTIEIPMVDLEEAVRLVTMIHENALETASMPDVAKGCGYSNPSSTPFYRRMVAARQFGLLSTGRPELTTRSRDYLKPES